LQVVPSQHGLVVEQSWPVCAHVVVTPPHVPCTEPGANVHVSPLQQSAVAEHAPFVFTQAVAPQCR